MDKDQTTLTYNKAIYQDGLYELINNIFNYISILCSLLVLIIIVTLRIKETNYSNRVSLRLIMYISLAEIFFSISQMLRIRPLPMWISYTASWGYIFSSLLICFLVIAILVNIKLIFLCDHKNTTHFERYYVLIPFSLAITLSILPFSFYFEFDQERNYFWYNSTTSEWTAYFGWITWSILCCIFSISLIIYHLKRHKKLFKTSTCSLILTVNNIKPSSSYLSKIISQYISRIIFYSLIPILTYSPTIISDLIFLYRDNNDISYTLNIISLIFLSSQGIFTFIIFLFDPIIYELILERQRDKSYKQNVIGTVGRGVYVENIYKIGLELPSSRDQRIRKPEESRKPFNIKKYCSISDLTFPFCDKRSIDTKSEISDDDTISLL